MLYGRDDYIKRKIKYLVLVIICIAFSITPVMATDILTVTCKESCYHGGSYNWQTHQWLNYCPMCGYHNTLYLEFDSSYPEGIIVCSHCDADYCGIHGTEHSTPPRSYLLPFHPPDRRGTIYAEDL